MKKEINWEEVDWSLNNGELSRLYGWSKPFFHNKRKLLGKPNATTPGKCRPENRFKESWRYSSKANPKIDLDTEYSFILEGGRKKPSSTWNKRVKLYYGDKCCICGYHRPPISNHCHHRIPIPDGGLNTIRNGIVLCSRCHEEVHAGLLDLPEFKPRVE